jgi:hypothetical protein
MSQLVGSNVDGTFGNNDWLKNTIPFVPPFMQKPIVGKPDLSQQLAQQKAEYEIARQQAIEKANANIQKPRTFIEMNQGYIIIGLVLVVSYFAYKKFKK